jgi:uncharacterized protein (TIGR02646 family)
MIRVHRPSAAPAPLAASLADALKLVRAAPPKTRKELPTTYRNARAELWPAQHYKCAYCEFAEQSKRNDVEHFRPAMEADREPGSAETHGYWWLAFEWSNLLFSCANCNQGKAKGTRFPLALGSVALVAEEQPPGLERPLLIDPALESGIPHIEFVLDARKNAWVPRARNGSLRGDFTIRTCRLDRTDLETLYGTYVTSDAFKKDLRNVVHAIETSEPHAVQAAWDDFCDRRITPSAPFVGLAHDVLAHYVDKATRARFGLTLPSL